MGFFSKLFARNILYYPGCLTKFVLKGVMDNYTNILEQINIDVITLKENEICCGSPVLNAGYEQDFEDVKRKNLDLFDEHGIRKIIVNCPACYHIFSKHYNLKVEHITQTILKKIDYFDKKFNEKITYHDPCHLGRYCDIYEEPRKILRKLGFKVIELEKNRQDALCCGGGAGLKGNYPKLASTIAKNIFKKVKTKKLITTCPMCYAHFKENAKDIEILELSEVLI